MLAGNLLIWFSAATLAGVFAVSLFSIRSSKLPAAARAMYTASALSLTAASILLLALLLGHRFDVQYVYGYTSRDLPAGFRISAFWAGQEGSFLLWALIGAWTGWAMIRRSGEIQAASAMVYCLAQGILLTMIAVNSPFKVFPETPPDGQGLNPILQDFWMAIHPPILFAGFAALTVPACLASGALITGKLDKWSNLALPWVSYGWFTLGAGLVLGGLWAYETLGWGGYWGWDPVENSSLVPWITGTVLLHGLIVEKRKNTSQRPNFLFAAVTYILVLYSTFLTRSGVLGDFSVHSFSNLGVAGLLGGMIAAMLALFAILIAWRFSRIPAPSIAENSDGKEVNHYIATWILSGLAILVLVGTSMPIISRLINPKEPQGVKAEFYNTTTAPLAFLMLALVALCPIMGWSARRKKDTPATGGRQTRRIGWILLGMTASVAVLLLVFGRSNGTLLAVSFLGLAAFVQSVYWFWRSLATSGVLVSAHLLAHAGFALMFVGIGASGLGKTTDSLALQPGQKAVDALNYKISLESVERENPTVISARLRLESGSSRGKTIIIRGKDSPMGIVFQPVIERGILQDIYFSPEQIQESGPGVPEGADTDKPVDPLEGSERLTPALIANDSGMRPEPATTRDGLLTVSVEGMIVERRAVNLTVAPKGGSSEKMEIAEGEVRQSGGWTIQFEGFGRMEQSPDGAMKATAVINVRKGEGAASAYGESGMQAQPAAPEEHEHNGETAGAFVRLRVSAKPLMSVLWLGAALCASGAVLSVIRRFKEQI